MTIGANCSRASPHLEEEEPLLVLQMLATLWVWGVYLIVAAALARRLDRMPNKQTTLVYFRPASLPGLTLAWPASVACSCWPVRRVRLRISCETNFKSMQTTQGDRGGVIAMRRRGGLHKLKIDIYHLNGQRSHPAAQATYKYGQACPWSKHNFMQK